jgi:hypothetical protein
MIIGNKNILYSAISLKEALLNTATNSEYNKIILASAFLTEKAVYEIKEFLDIVLAYEVVFLVGTKNHFTSPNSIKKILGLANTYKNIHIKLPVDPEFHLKCYYFSPSSKSLKSISTDFCYVGSGNLTEAGLDSQSELLVKIYDSDTVNEVLDYLNAIIKNSINWSSVIERYADDCEKQCVKAINYQPFIPKNRDRNINDKIKPILISNSARTIDVVVRADEYEEKFAMESYNLLSKEHLNLNKNNWVVFSDLSGEEIEQRRREYKIGSYFDREDGYNGSGWQIGTKRKICKVGAFYVDQDLRRCVLFRVKREVIPYVVTKEVIKKAEELGIKTEDDENSLPTQKDMIKYIEFINKIREKEKH